MGRRFTPVQWLIGLAFAGIAYLVAVTWVSVDQRWLGLDLAMQPGGGAVATRTRGPAAAIPVGTRIVGLAGGGDRIDFVPRDFTVEPDGAIGTYADYDIFLGRQDRLATIKDQPAVEVRAADGRRWTVAPLGHRPIFSLPVEYWVQIFVGLFAWLISASIFAFRRQETSARYLLLNGFSTLVFAPMAAIYSTREIALHAALFQPPDSLNFLGGSLFVASLLALLLYYPRVIAPRWVGWAVVGVYVAWYAAQELGAFTSMTDARRWLVLAGVLATFVLAAVQWRITRADPIARASLQWFLLSWLLGITLFCAIIFIPEILGGDTAGLQPYAFTLFLLVYGGLAFGIIRYRLFDLGAWWTRALTWTVSIIALVALDMVFLYVVGLSSQMSLALALLICGLFWLPLRGWLWGRLVARPPADSQGRFNHLVDTAFKLHADERHAGWTDLLRETYTPLEVEPSEGGHDHTRIEADGLTLAIPAVGDAAPAVRLRYALSGRRLFTRADAELADELVAMFDHIARNQTAYEQGVSNERRRITSDIHDNIGASLLGALHSGDPERKDRLIRETLSDLRVIINGGNSPGMTINEGLILIRREIADRLEARGMTLDWISDEDDRPLSPAQVHSLHSIIREAVSNAIKHSGAATVTVRVFVNAERLSVMVKDDGQGFDQAQEGNGIGLSNIRDRVASLQGELEWLGHKQPDRKCGFIAQLPLG